MQLPRQLLLLKTFSCCLKKELWHSCEGQAASLDQVMAVGVENGGSGLVLGYVG